jgi:MFS family permease
MSIAESLSPAKERVWNKYFNSIFVYALLCQFTMTVTNYVLPLYVVNALNASVSTSGVLSSVFAAGSMICRFATGNLTDRYGRRMIMIMGAAIVAVSMFVLGFTTSIAMIIVFKVVQGVGHALNSTASNAAAADTVPKSRYSEGIGYYAMSSTIIGAIGATIIIWLMSIGSATGEADNYSLPLIVAGVCGIVAAVIGIFLNYEKKMNIARKKASGKKFNIHDYIEVRALLPALLVLFQCICSGSGLFHLLYATDIGLGKAMSLYYIISTIVSVTARFTIGRITGRFKPMYVVLFAVILQISAYLYLALEPGLLSLYYMAVIQGLFSAILSPLLNALSLKSAPTTRSGAASATYWLGFDIGMAISPVIFGVVIDIAGYSTSFIVGAICMAVFAVCAVLILRKVKPLDEIAQPEEAV